MGYEVNRGRPCARCGGRFYVKQIHPLFGLIAMVASVWGALAAFQDFPYGLDVSMRDGGIGFAIALVAGLIGSRKRCVNCDSVR